MNFKATQTTPIDGEATFTIELWSNRPPTHDEIVAAGGTVGTIHHTRTVANNITPNKRDIGFISAYDTTNAHITPSKRKHNARLFCADWASQLYIVRAVIDGEKARIFTIARYRDTGALYAFTYAGIPYRRIKARKHVKPSFVRQTLDIREDIEITVDCVQLDAIRNAQTEGRAHKRVTIPDLPYSRTGSLRTIEESAESKKRREKREKARNEKHDTIRNEYGIDEDIPTVDTVGYIGCTDCSRPVHATRPTHDERAATLAKRRQNLEKRRRAIEARRNPTQAIM